MATTIYPRVKRAADALIAGAALALTAPVIGAVAVAVRRELGSPVLFRQQRPGLHGDPFELVKFRTMLLPEQVGTDDDAPRMTPLGAWLRSTSLDELPTLWNVLRGNMSLVGPRPLLTEYLNHYSPEQNRRHQIRPGITGLAQVSGRNELDWEQRFELDVQYVDSCSPRLDAIILLRTVAVAFSRKGVNGPGSSTMTKYAETRPMAASSEVESRHANPRRH